MNHFPWKVVVSIIEKGMEKLGKTGKKKVVLIIPDAPSDHSLQAMRS
jgi:hypothetical protein